MLIHQKMTIIKTEFPPN